MVHGKLVWRELLAAVVADAFVELVFPPGRAFEFSGFVPFFANVFGGFGVRLDFKVGFGGHGFYLPLAPAFAEAASRGQASLQRRGIGKSLT